MIRTLWVTALSTLALGLAACAEKPQEAATAFTASGWKVGDEGSWGAHMQTRTQAQNEHVRLGVSR
jgi:hypothetical protein